MFASRGHSIGGERTPEEPPTFGGDASPKSCERGARQWLANVALAGWLAADSFRLAIFANSVDTDILDVLAGLAFLTTAGLVLTRTRPQREDVTLSTITIALSSAFVPLLLVWQAPETTVRTAPVVVAQAIATVLMIAGLLWLGRNFSVVPQYRSLRTGGPYALVRHPIYASYLIFDGALAWGAATPVTAGIWFAEAALLTWRARLEERLLAASDEAYAAYISRVRWRFLPFVH